MWAAGIRTHMLVCVGACLVMIVSAYGLQDVLNEHVVLDPSRVAAQVVSGIGFLGAGSILLRALSSAVSPLPQVFGPLLQSVSQSAAASISRGSLRH